MVAYKRTVLEPEGKHILVYQANGWVLHIMEYPDGTREEWLDRE